MVATAEDVLQFLAGAIGNKAAPKPMPYDYGYFGQGYKHDASGTPITVGYSHGPGGNLSFPGTDPEVFHTVVGNRGLIGQLPVRGSNQTNPTYTLLTGVGADSGSEDREVCDPAVTAGLMETAVITSVFGRYERATKEIEINRLGLVNDRADPMDLRLVGTPIAQAGLFTNGPGDPSVPGNVLQSEMARKFWEMGVSLHRLLSQQLWVGNPANNNAAKPGYKEVTGLDILINDGYVDALTGSSIPEADSNVINFGFVNAGDNGTDIVAAVTQAYHYAFDLADRTGVNPVRWVLAMRQEVFYELTAVWPCAYLSWRCGFDDQTSRLVIDGTEQVRLRDEMRNGRYLLIDGNRVEVVVDDGIPYATNTTQNGVPNTCVASTIYLVPMSVLGGRAVTYIEHVQYQNPDILAALGNMVIARIEGPWITTLVQTRWCVSWQTKIEPRVVLRTPWLAARIDNVVVCPPQMTRQPFPDDPYFVGGNGETWRDGPSYHVPWSA